MDTIMSNKHPCKPGAKRRFIILAISSVVIIVVIEVLVCTLGFKDWSLAPGSIFRDLIMDALIFVFWWYFGYL